MTTTPPADVTMGELWRGLMDQRDTLTALVDEVRALPGRLAADLAKDVDARFVAHGEQVRLQNALDDQRMAAIEQRVALVERTIRGVVGFVFVTVGGGILALIIDVPVH